MTADSRILRSRGDALDDRIGVAGRSSDLGQRFLGRVFDGGSMPTGPDRVYLLHPVGLDGDESEGAAASLSDDDGREVPVIVLGSRQVAVGDALVAHSVAGRWIAEGGISRPGCGPRCACCPGVEYAINGTIADARGTWGLTYDGDLDNDGFGIWVWHSPWIPFNYVDPIFGGTRASLYLYEVRCVAGQFSASIFYVVQRGEGRYAPLAAGELTGWPPSSGGAGSRKVQTSPGQAPFDDAVTAKLGTVGPVACSPLGFTATFAREPFDPDPLPSASATVSIPASSGGGDRKCCLPCPLPRRDLTISWANIHGNGSATLAYDGAAGGSWATASCAGTGAPSPHDWGFRFALSCGGQTSLRLDRYDAGGGCATRFRFYFSSNGFRPLSDPTGSTGSMRLVYDYTCEPLLLRWATSGGGSIYDTDLYNAGFRSFAVTL